MKRDEPSVAYFEISNEVSLEKVARDLNLELNGLTLKDEFGAVAIVVQKCLPPEKLFIYMKKNNCEEIKIEELSYIREIGYHELERIFAP